MFGGSSQDFGAHVFRCGMRSVASHYCASASEGADAPMELVGVPGHHVDVRDRDADLVGDDLGEAGKMALTLGADAGCEHHPAATLDLDTGALVGTDAGACDKEHHTAAHPPTHGQLVELHLGDENLVADRVERLVENWYEIAAVVM